VWIAFVYPRHGFLFSFLIKSAFTPGLEPLKLVILFVCSFRKNFALWDIWFTFSASGFSGC